MMGFRGGVFGCTHAVIACSILALGIAYAPNLSSLFHLLQEAVEREVPPLWYIMESWELFRLGGLGA